LFDLFALATFLQMRLTFLRDVAGLSRKNGGENPMFPEISG